MTVEFVGGIVIGAIIGVCAVLVLTGLAIWVLDVRRALREGDALEGDAMERNRKREES